MTTTIETLNMTRQIGSSGGYAAAIARTASSNRGVDAALQFVVGSSHIDVRLANRVTISALRLELTFEKRFNYRAPDLSLRIQDLNNYINFQDNIITFVILDMNEKGIAPGDGSLMRIPFESDQKFEVTAAYASTGSSGIAEIAYTVTKDSSGEESLVLEQNDPNPFSGRTRMDFMIPSAAATKLVIYDVGGALIRTLLDSNLEAGIHSVEWDGRDDSGKWVESGIYLYKLYAGVYSVTKKMVYLK